MKKARLMLNQKGQITVDFLFACILIMGVSVLLGALTFALTLSEVVQYVSYSAARNYFAGEATQAEQLKSADTKYNSLLHTLPFFNTALANGWISIASNQAADFTNSSYVSGLGAPPDSDPTRSQYVGYMITFKLPLLQLNLPLFGQIVQPPDGSDSFQATVRSFLMREPTTEECQKYNQQVYQALLQQGGYSPQGGGANPSAFVDIEDNGC